MGHWIVYCIYHDGVGAGKRPPLPISQNRTSGVQGSLSIDALDQIGTCSHVAYNRALWPFNERDTGMSDIMSSTT